MFLLKFLLPFMALGMIIAGCLFAASDEDDWIPAAACFLIGIAYAVLAYFWITRF